MLSQGFVICTRIAERRDLNTRLSLWVDRVNVNSRLGALDFHSLERFSVELASRHTDPTIAVDAMVPFIRSTMNSRRSLDVSRMIESIDGLMSVVLQEYGIGSSSMTDLYTFLFLFGSRVLAQQFASPEAWRRLIQLNCASLFSDRYLGWRKLIDPPVFESLTQNPSSGWCLMEDRIRCMDSTPQRLPTSTHSPGLKISDFDFTQVALRSLLHSSASSQIGLPSLGLRCSQPVGAVHVAHFRFLISRVGFARHITYLISLHNATSHVPAVPVTTSAHRPRADSVDSCASLPTLPHVFDRNRKTLNTPIDIFSIHALVAIYSFGTGMLVQISNDLGNAISHSPNSVVELVLASSPGKATSESQLVIRNYLTERICQALRNSARANEAESCFSMLVRGEMAIVHRPKWSDEFRVLSALIFSALQFCISERLRRCAELRNRVLGYMRFQRGILAQQRIASWVAYYACSVFEPTAAVPRLALSAFTPDTRKVFRALYREFAAITPNDSSWEQSLATKLYRSSRLMDADLRLLITTANGMGVPPVPAPLPVPAIEDQPVIVSRPSQAVADLSSLPSPSVTPATPPPPVCEPKPLPCEVSTDTSTLAEYEPAEEFQCTLVEPPGKRYSVDEQGAVCTPTMQRSSSTDNATLQTLHAVLEQLSELRSAVEYSKVQTTGSAGVPVSIGPAQRDDPIVSELLLEEKPQVSESRESSKAAFLAAKDKAANMFKRTAASAPRGNAM